MVKSHLKLGELHYTVKTERAKINPIHFDCTFFLVKKKQTNRIYFDCRTNSQIFNQSASKYISLPTKLTRYK